MIGAFRFGGVQRNSGWQPRRRFQLGGGYKWKQGDWTFSYTTRLQFSFDISTERRDADQNSSWRNKLDVGFKGIKKTPLNYSIELFHGVKATEAFEYQDWRMVWSVGRKLSKRHEISVFFLIQKNRVPRIAEVDRILGFNYSIDIN